MFGGRRQIIPFLWEFRRKVSDCRLIPADGGDLVGATRDRLVLPSRTSHLRTTNTLFKWKSKPIRIFPNENDFASHAPVRHRRHDDSYVNLIQTVAFLDKQ